MYCPNCAQSNAAEQKFCRRCGLNLEKVGESLELQLHAGGIEPVDRRLEIFGNVAFGGLGIVGSLAVAGMIYTVIQKFVLTGQGVIFGIVMSLLLVFGVMAIAYVILNESRNEKSKKRRPKASESELTAPDTAKLLVDRPFEGVPSVVEDTTELLKTRSHRS